MRSLYDVLDLAPGCSYVEIRKAYRTLIKKYHSDVNGDPSALKTCVEINRAYEVLGDAENRAKYDQDHNFPQPDKKRDNTYRTWDEILLERRRKLVWYSDATLHEILEQRPISLRRLSDVIDTAGNVLMGDFSLMGMLQGRLLVTITGPDLLMTSRELFVELYCPVQQPPYHGTFLGKHTTRTLAPLVALLAEEMPRGNYKAEVSNFTLEGRRYHTPKICSLQVGDYTILDNGMLFQKRMAGEEF